MQTPRNRTRPIGTTLGVHYGPEDRNRVRKQEVRVIRRQPAPKPIWLLRRDELVPVTRTKPIRRSAPLPRVSDFSEAGLHAADTAARMSQEAPPYVPRFEIGTWAVDPNGCLMRLRELDLSDPRLIERERPAGVIVARYAEWLLDGATPPPVTLIETEDFRLLVSDGHHRLQARRTALVWSPGAVSTTFTAWIAPVYLRPSYRTDRRFPIGLTHEQAILEAVKHGCSVPDAVIGDYPRVADALARGLYHLPCDRCGFWLDRFADGYTCAWCGAPYIA